MSVLLRFTGPCYNRLQEVLFPHGHEVYGCGRVCVCPCWGVGSVSEKHFSEHVASASSMQLANTQPRPLALPGAVDFEQAHHVRVGILSDFTRRSSQLALAHRARAPRLRVETLFGAQRGLRREPLVQARRAEVVLVLT